MAILNSGRKPDMSGIRYMWMGFILASDIALLLGKLPNCMKMGSGL